jgi:uncharacterized membrane protein
MTVYTVTSVGVPHSTAYGINNAGQIAGSYLVVNSVSPINIGNYGFVSNPKDGIYTTLDDPLVFRSGSTSAQGINDGGQVVGSYNGFPNGPSVTHGFLYSGGSYATLDDPEATAGTFAYGIWRSRGPIPRCTAGRYPPRSMRWKTAMSSRTMCIKGRSSMTRGRGSSMKRRMSALG